ncbi:MAG: PD-(D/E)XK nuclease-like domain-containing protein [Prevotellaceae bacterium]|jgi:hypothetical protein|nr:PD-(D/E)XK nuclease-like domain-containing protein [Prevotellaceae bacterium]
MNYYSRKEVSNSDLSWLKQQLYPRDAVDLTEAYRFGSLIDAMITEPSRVDYFARTLDGERFSAEDFQKAERMKKSFYADDFCRMISARMDGQKVMSARRTFDFQGYDFELDCRCKWDIWRGDLGWGGDIKSTAATTQSQFEDAAKFFDYDRQRAWYMDIAGAQKDVLIGISKVNFKVFRIFIGKGSALYEDGRRKYSELAMKWHLMFGDRRPEECGYGEF